MHRQISCLSMADGTYACILTGIPQNGHRQRVPGGTEPTTGCHSEGSCRPSPEPLRLEESGVRG
jgi:hypothetical protein